MYKITVSYPDGHMEELFEMFNDLNSAVEYGKEFLNQVRNTERFKNKQYTEALEAYFFVSGLKDDSYVKVYDSRYNR